MEKWDSRRAKGRQVGQEDLQPKDYVKIFLGPLIPAPNFAAMVEIFDAYAKGDIFNAYYLLMTQTTPAAFYIVAMAILKDVKTGSNELGKQAATAKKDGMSLWRRL